MNFSTQRLIYIDYLNRLFFQFMFIVLKYL